MDIKKLKPKLNFLKTPAKTRPVFGKILVDDNGLYCTDMETTIGIKHNFGMSEGFQDIETLGLVASVQDDEMLDTMPKINPGLSIEKTMVNYKELEILNKHTSKDETRLHINSVAFDKTFMVATCGHVLKETALENELKETYLLPRTSIDVLIKLLKFFKNEENIEIQFNESFAIVETEDFKFSSRLIVRDYVEWQSVLPTKFEKSFQVENWPKLKDIKPLLDKRSMAVHFEGKQGKVFLKFPKYPNESMEIGTTEHDFSIGFNANYVNLASQGNKSFEVLLNSEINPTRVFKTIVMPLKL